METPRYSTKNVRNTLATIPALPPPEPAPVAHCGEASLSAATKLGKPASGMGSGGQERSPGTGQRKEQTEQTRNVLFAPLADKTP